MIVADHASKESKPDVIVLGSSICGLMTAAYLRREFPDLEVCVVGPPSEREKRPIVGESLLEPATYFLAGLGLNDYLESNHTIKEGLSFYYKLSAEDRYRYTVHSPEKLHRASRQLQRPRFDDDLRQHAETLGVRFVDGLAREIEVGPGREPHRLTIRTDDGEQTLQCQWVVDCTGRSRWLGKQVTTYHRPKDRQRSVFWFRLANFERFSEHLELEKRRPLKYDLWYTTHHFMGRGYFIWNIPLQSPDHESMISIGLTYRPDLFEHPMRSMDDFLKFVDEEHPAISDMVRSGEVLDTQTYGNFIYWAEQIYSPDGWFLVGDTARAVDPLYSSGLSMTAVGVEQVGEIISRQRGEGITDKQIQSFQNLWKTISAQGQEDITSLYECMDDPFQACMRRYWNNITWFNVFLPLWWNGLYHDVDAAPLLYRLFEQGKPMSSNAAMLFSKVAGRVGKELTQDDYDAAVDFDWLLNPEWDCRRPEVPSHFSQLFRKRAGLRWRLLQMTGYRDLPTQLIPLAIETVMHRLTPLIMRMGAGNAFRSTEQARTFASTPVPAATTSTH